jgi:hypothetical protein
MLASKKQSKRDKIIEMLSQGFDVDYITSKLHTTKQNVYKEKSKQKSLEYGKENFRLQHAIQSKRRSKRIPDSELGKTQDSTLGDNPPYGSYNALKRPTKKEYSILFTEFLARKKPEDIIARHGIDPEIVEKEYQRFLKLRGMDISDLQSSLVKMSNTYSAHVKPLLNKLETGTILSNEEIMVLVNSISDERVLKLISDVTVTPPGLIVRPSCSKCDNYIPGILTDIPNSRILEEENENYLCSDCMQ